jgi:hypothetical protein
VFHCLVALFGWVVVVLCKTLTTSEISERALQETKFLPRDIKLQAGCHGLPKGWELIFPPESGLYQLVCGLQGDP